MDNYMFNYNSLYL